MLVSLLILRMAVWLTLQKVLSLKMVFLLTRGLVFYLKESFLAVWLTAMLVFLLGSLDLNLVSY